MRGKAWALALMVVLMGALPATAGKGRVAKSTYNFDLTKPGVSAWFGEDYAVYFGDEVTFETTKADRTVAVTVVDDSTEAVSAAIWQEGSPGTVFCQRIESVPITGGQPVYVRVVIDMTPAPETACATSGLPTTGTVTAKFTGAAKMRHGHHHDH